MVILTPSLRMDEGLILADSSGRGGDIEVRVGRLTLTGGAQIGSNSATGQGGNVLITATESATIFGHSPRPRSLPTLVAVTAVPPVACSVKRSGSAMAGAYPSLPPGSSW